MIPLDFKPRKAWPTTLPALAWGGIIFAGDTTSTGAIVTVENATEMSTRVETFNEALLTAYPTMGLGELSRLFKAAKSHPQYANLESNWTDLFSRYGYRDGENFRQTLQLLEQAPPEFVEWVDDKGLGLRDLAALRACRDLNFMRELLTFIGGAKPAKNVGAQAIEWAVDLHLMGQAIDLAVADAGEFAQWHGKLKDFRFSQRSSARSNLSEVLKKVSWPKEVQANTLEKGDRLGFEVKIFAETAADFALKIEQLGLCSEQIKKGLNAK